MAFNSIPSADIATGKPLKQSLFQKIKDNDDYLYDELGVIRSSGVANGSFELDTDANGIPDSWERYLWSGGSGAMESTDPGHGAKGYRITAGSGQGGGYLTMLNYLECSQYAPLEIGWMLKSSVVDIKNIVRVLWYTAAKTPCATASTDLYSEAAANPLAWTSYVARGVVPPDGARFFKIRLIGADSSDATNGYCLFDGVYASPATNRGWAWVASGTIAEDSTTGAGWEDNGSVNVVLPVLSASSLVRLSFRAAGYASGESSSGGQRFTFGGAYSNPVLFTEGNYKDYEYTILLSGSTGGTVALTQQLMAGAGTAYGKKDDSVILVEILAW